MNASRLVSCTAALALTFGCAPGVIGLRSALALLVALVGITGCAQLAPPKMDYRAGLALYSNPRFSFQVPEGWRVANPDDWSRFSITERARSRLSAQGRAQAAAAVRKAWPGFAAVFIHDSGAWMDVMVSEFKSLTRFPRGYTLGELEKDRMWDAFAKTYVDKSPSGDKPRITRVSLDLKDNTQGPALFVVFKKEDLSGESIWSVLGFVSENHTVTVEYGIAAGRPSDGIEGLDVVARTFRFE